MNEKLCDDCEHFLRHYVKHNLSFKTTCSGHCLMSLKWIDCKNNKNICKRYKHKDANQENQQIQKDKKNISDYIISINKKLTSIEEFLKF